MITILMPVRNAAPFLDECLLSIIGQSIAEWELIAIDDHSTDSSFEILEGYAEIDKRIKCFENYGKGIIDALTLGFNKSSGEFITRMDADDVMDQDKLLVLSHLLDQNPGSVVTSKVNYFSAFDLGEGYEKYQDWLNSFMDTGRHYTEIYKECVLPSPNWMMERSTLKRIGGFDSLEYPEDYDLCFKLYEAGVPIIASTAKLHFWRDYAERTSRNDPHYADNRFTHLKVRYFIRCDYEAEKTLFVWGAGSRGKLIAKELIDAKIPFKWITGNLKKIGKDIYGTKAEESALSV
jgi:glycosyltransferase involved in cell wall biosynthesis